MRTIDTYLRLTDLGAVEVTSENKPKGVKSFIIRNQPVTLKIGIFQNENATSIMTKAALEELGCEEWRLDISKNHSLSYPVYLQPDYPTDDDEETQENPVSVDADGYITVILQTTDTLESAAAISGMQFDMWEAELTGLPAKEEATEETESGAETEENSGDDETDIYEVADSVADKRQPIMVLQWQIGYTNRVSSEAADPPSLTEKYYYTITQTKAILASLKDDIEAGYADAIAAAKAELETLIAMKVPIISDVVFSADNVLSPEPGKTYRWTVNAGTAGRIAFEPSHLPEDGDGAEIDIYISLGDGASVDADGDNVSISDAVIADGWYTLTAVNENGTVTAALYAKMGQGVIDGGEI